MGAMKGKTVRILATALVAGGLGSMALAADTPPSGVTLVDLTAAESGAVFSAGTPYSSNRGADNAFDGSVSGETNWSSKESRYYNCQQVDYVPYTYYKFACTENNGNSLVQIHEIYFTEKHPGAL